MVLLTSALAYWRGNGRAFCNTPGCGAFAQLLHASINESFSPCDNFGRFVCDGWRQSHQYSVNEEFYRVAHATMSRNFLRVNVPPKGQNAKHQMAALYRSCHNLRASGRDDTKIVKALLLEAGVVWPARPANPSVLDTLVYLAMKLGWAAVLNIEVKTAHSDRVLVLLSPELAGHVVRTARLPRTKRLEYFGRLRRAFTPGDISMAQSIVTFEDVVHIEDTMLQVLASAARDRQPNLVNASGLCRSAEEWNTTISKFRRTGGRLYFQTVYARFVETFGRLWRRHGEKSTHLFVSWFAVRFAAHFAHESLVNPAAAEKARGGTFHRGLFCLVPLYVVMGDLAFALYSASVWPAHVRLDVKVLVLSVREAFIRLLSANASFAPGARALSSWSAVGSVLSVLDYAGDARSLLENAVSGFPDVGDVFALNWVDMMGAVAQNKQPLRRSMQPRTLHFMRLAEENFPARDFVLVPFALAHPMYDVGSTAAVKYGGLGSHVALASARIVLDVYGGERAAENTTARRHVRAFRECLEAASLDAPVLSLAEELVALAALLAAFRRADDADGRRLQGLPGFSSAQLFFIAWCFMRCSASEKKDTEEKDPCSPVLRHVEDFSDAFHCDRNTRLNPDHRCRLL